MKIIDAAAHLETAKGYFELEMFEDAHAELDLLDEVPESAVPVGTVRLALYSYEERWDDAARYALALCELEPGVPEHFFIAATVMKALGLPGAGVDLLLNGPPVLREFPEYHYELARDHLRFDEIYPATLALQEACQLDPQYPRLGGS